MLKAAVIGVGSIGRNHARIYADISDIDLCFVCDSNGDMGQGIANKYNTVWGNDLDKLLDEHDPDIVSVCVPTIYHHAVAKKTLSRGIHTLVEKPIANTKAEGEELIALAKEQGIFLTVGHIERFNPAIMELKKRLDANEIGKIFRVQARRMSPFPARIRDVGVTIDLATHDIDIIRYILNDDVVRVSSEIASVLTEHDDLMDAVLSLKKGVRATLNISRVTPTKVRELTVTGSQGMFAVNYLTQDLYFYKNGVAPHTWESLTTLTGVSEGDMLRVAIPNKEPLYTELEHFVNSVQENTAPLVSGEDGLKALIVAQAILESGRTHLVTNL
jgi:UDP-N-acetylglucosamine 3-dehydrogenase